MTRINTIPPADLTDQHLFAEYRELPRIFALVLLALRANRPLTGPDRYTMGAGHVRFFYTRTNYLSRRQSAIIAELIDRGYQLSHLEAPAPLDDSTWEPDEQDVQVNLARLRERLHKPGARYTHRRVEVSQLFYGAGIDGPSMAP